MLGDMARWNDGLLTGGCGEGATGELTLFRKGMLWLLCIGAGRTSTGLPMEDNRAEGWL